MVPLLAKVYELIVHQKRDTYVCWSDCQLALHRLIEIVLHIAGYIWGHWLEGEVLLERAVLAGGDLDFSGGVLKKAPDSWN